MGERVRLGGVGLSRPARTEHPKPDRPSRAPRTRIPELVRPHLLTRTSSPDPISRTQPSRTCVRELGRLDRSSRTGLPKPVGRCRWAGSGGGYGEFSSERSTRGGGSATRTQEAETGSRHGSGFGVQVRGPPHPTSVCLRPRGPRFLVFVAVSVILKAASACEERRIGLYCTYVRRWCASSCPGRWCGRGAGRARRGRGVGGCGLR